MSSYNIVKKIKSNIFKGVLIFMNKLIKNGKEEIKLYSLDYKYINQLKKEKDLNYINMKLKDLLSFDISPKQKYKPSDFNKILIYKIINKKQYVEDYNTTIFSFFMTLKEWLDLFLKKKNINDLKEKYYLEEINNVNFEKIEKCIGNVNILLNEILEFNDE